MKFIALCILLFVMGVAQSQIDFNNYEKVKSKGEIPESFKLTLEERFSQDFQTDYGLSQRDQYEYVFSKSASIDNLIQSGLVVYGDDMTAYIQDLAKKLLKDDMDLYNSLSFFTLRSNVSNAFVTGDGMVFVTMGLLSQLASESDLAFVLSHEIAHFEQKHVLTGFKIRKELEKQDLDDEIENFSDYSKKHELEADSIGLTRYLKSGYSIDGVEQVFDILMYSHLPIDEVDISMEYLIGNNAYFPEEYLLKEEKEISFTEDYDDKNSTHPNIKSRKKYALKLYEENLSEYKGKDQNLLGENRFENIRSIARFERVQNWLYARSYANCLYEIAVLEKSYPNNKFLKRWKAIAWTNAAVYATMGNNSDIFTSSKKLEGKIAGIHHVFDKFSDEDFIVFAMRNVLDLKSEFPDDRMFAKMEETLFYLMVEEDMDFAEFKDISLNDAVEELHQHLDSIRELESSMDTIIIQVDKNEYGYSEEEWSELSKYEKLKVKKEFKKGGHIKSAAQIDTSEYLLYALPDIAKNEDYVNRFEKYIDEKGRKEDLRDSISMLKPRQLAKYNEKLNSLELKNENLIFVEPLAIRMNYGKVKYMKTLKLTERMHKAYDEYPEKFDKKESIVNLNKHNLANVGTDGYNARAALERYFYRYMDIKSNYYINPDMDEFDDISKEYNSDYFVFSLLVDDKRLTLSRYYLVLSFYTFFTALPPHVIIELTKMHKVKYSVLVFDLENGYVVKQKNYSFNSNPRKTVLSLYLNDVINN